MALRRWNAHVGMIAGVMWSGPVLAQDLPQQTTLAQADIGSADILVQARRRTESIEDVPASVSVLGEVEMERLSIRDVADYTRQTPGAILIGSGPEYLNDIALRGQGGGRLGFSESSTGIYRDGIYVAGGGFGGRSYGRIDFYDLDRVEVYRGPQGALYGRNAVGGAVNVISHKPTMDTEVRGRLGYNSVDKLDTQLTLNLPVGETVAIRAGGYYAKQTGGFYTDQVTGRTIDNTLDWGLRGAAGFGLGTDSSAILTIEHSRSEAPGFTSIGRNRTLDPDIFVRTGLDTIDRVTIDQTQVIGEFRHDFGTSELTILADYKSRDGARSDADFDHYLGLRLPNVRLLDAQGENFERYGAEARWGSSGNTPITWLAGVDFLTFVSEVYSNRTGTVTGTGTTVTSLRRQLRRQQSRENVSSYSAYGQLGFRLAPKLTLSVEARYQIDDKQFAFQQIDLDPTTNETIPLTNFSRNWNRFLPTASLTWEPSDRLTVYGRVATGYRAGGFNQSPVNGFFDRVPYDPEDVTAAEIGVKGRFNIGAAHFRSQLATYVSWTRDVQQTTTLSPTNPAFTLENVGGNRIIGAEYELTGTVPLASGRLSGSLNVSRSRGRWNDNASILFNGAVLDLGGKVTPRARDYIINLNGMYDLPLGGGITGMLTASYQTAAGGWDDASLTRKSQNYSILDLSAGLRGDNWTLLASVKNVTNQLYYIVSVGGNDYYNAPRTYGATLSFNF